MSRKEQEGLSYEATMQTKLIRNLIKWFRIALSLSTTGIFLVWWGLSRPETYLLPVIAGAVIIVLCILAAFFINVSIHNGQRNVKKILSVLEGGN